MKKLKKVLAILLVMIMAVSCLSACGDKKDPKKDTVTPPTDTADDAADDAATGDNTTEPDDTAEPDDTTEPDDGADEAASSTPRNETLYFNGQQWGTVNAWNPMHGNNNNFCMSAGASARVIVYETLFIYNLLDGQLYPLLGTDFAWNEDQTEMTVHLNPDAKWSDGTPVTAEDVAYTWETHKKYESSTYSGNAPYLDTIEALDDNTVLIKPVIENGTAANPLMIMSYLAQTFVMQKAYVQKVEERNGNDATKIKEDTMDDFVASGPYKQYFDNEQKVIYVRDDNYWGQAESMWGSLPVPKYLAHNIFADNAAGNLAFSNGEVDVSQQFNLDIASMMENSQTISTYIDEAPYNVCVTMPTLWFNVEKPGLDRKEVRKAIAMAVDYDQIVTAAMGGQCPSFSDVPRSVMNPTEGEQALVDHSKLADYVWENKDVEGANKLLDDAGIVDSDGDGVREVDGQNLHFQAACPKGWNDWEASLEIVASAGKEIGIEIETYFPEAATYMDMLTNHDFEIGMYGTVGAGITSPWGRVRGMMSSEFIGMMNNWSGNYGWYKNDRADELIKMIPFETDTAKLTEYYTELSQIYLDECPSVSLMYRPELFYNTNEVVWTGFPAADDGQNIPPTDCTDGYGVKGLYVIELIEE